MWLGSSMCQNDQNELPPRFSHDQLKANAARILVNRNFWWVMQELGVGARHIDVLATCPNSRHRVVGVECKASRGDLLRDLRSEKWRFYLPYTSEFWFMVNPDICDPSEIPKECGVVETRGNRMTKVRRRSPRPHRKITDRRYCRVLEALFAATRSRPDHHFDKLTLEVEHWKNVAEGRLRELVRLRTEGD